MVKLCTLDPTDNCLGVTLMEACSESLVFKKYNQSSD